MCSTAENLVNACHVGQLPSLATVCDFGLDGCEGTNPVAIFECYKVAVIKDNIDFRRLNAALMKGTLNDLIMKKCPNVKKCSVYDEVLKKGGIHTAWDKKDNAYEFHHLECPQCQCSSLHPEIDNDNVQCANCDFVFKKNNSS